jgi:predicted transcriptional regulator of viral defense system
MGGISKRGSSRAAAAVRKRIEKGGERVWRLADFRDLPFGAVAQALSRLARSGAIERRSKGVYYRARQTAFGRSRPNPASIQRLAGKLKPVFPSGVAAANLLRFSTQTPRRTEVSTTGLSLPRKLAGEDAIIHVRRPEAWKRLSAEDAALLEFLRGRGETSELSAERTIRKTLTLLAERGRFERLLKVADTEPPRVRALLGALGEQLGKKASSLRSLRDSLNPFSKFDFGLFAKLDHARKWQARIKTVA